MDKKIAIEQEEQFSLQRKKSYSLIRNINTSSSSLIGGQFITPRMNNRKKFELIFDNETNDQVLLIMTIYLLYSRNCLHFR